MLYIHIPFCASKCAYCDFFSVRPTSHFLREFLLALAAELRERCAYLSCRKPLTSLYIGGGTPSLLSPAEISAILNLAHRYFTFAPDAELTIEVNPDDVTPAYAHALLSLGFNRVSVGIQSFSDAELRAVRRRHTAAEATSSILTLADAGFSNISLDLIYGLPHQTLTAWQTHLRQAFSLPITHLSAYALTVSPGTRLFREAQTHAFTPLSDEAYTDYFEALSDIAQSHDFLHYEVSNFCRPGFASRHNSGYWDGTPYLGLGPAAHSFNGVSRACNPSSLRAYTRGYIHATRSPLVVEHLTLAEHAEEFLLLRLRTAEGIPLQEYHSRFGEPFYAQLLRGARRWETSAHLIRTATHIRLARSGWMLSDAILADLVY